jgi:hypothetical protein
MLSNHATENQSGNIGWTEKLEIFNRSEWRHVPLSCSWIGGRPPFNSFCDPKI